MEFSATQRRRAIEESDLRLSPSISQQHFKWGGTPISPKNRNNSSVCLLNTTPQRVTTKIDPRIYADVHSKGLASRIVQYHENGARLRRSMSANNIGSSITNQYSTTRLKKPALPAFKATKQNIPITRIAPQEKSVFYGNTLSSLLRSNSVMGLQKTDEEISRENRPIIHPPPTENELEPTRSVLEVLKEISRKRITHQDPSATNEQTKKYCNRESNDAVDKPYPQELSYKRHRSHMNSNLLQYQPSHSNPTSTQTIPNGTQSDLQLSPEQVAKKRLCSYNNDITSSLSSSALHANKRKFHFEKQATIAKNAHNLSAEDDYSRKAKILCQQQTQLTHRTDTPTSTDDISKPHSQTILAASLSEDVIATPRRTASAPVNSIVEPSHNAKPKLTLFNKNYDNCNERVALDLRSSDDISPEQCEYAGIQFVKPKKSSAIRYTKNPLIERTQKSKLALMLCALRGELYQGDEIDGAEQAESSKGTVEENKNKLINVGDSATVVEQPAKITTNTTMTTITTAPTTTKADVVNKEDTTVGNVNKTGEQTTLKSTDVSNVQKLTQTTPASATATPTTAGGFNFIPPTTTVSPLKSASPLVGIKLSPANPIQAAPSITFSSASVVPVESSNIATTSVPVLSGFSFSNASTGTPTAHIVPMIGSDTISTDKSKPVATVSFGIMNDTSSSKPFSFVTPTTTTATTATAETAPSTATAATFTFGNAVPTNTATLNPLAVTAASTAASTAFTFGNAAPTNTATLTPLVNSSTSIPTAATFSFGKASPASNATTESTAATSVPNKTTSFAFGASIQKPTDTSKQFSFVAKPQSETTETSATKNTFDFGASASTNETTTNGTSSITSTFTFGAPTIAATNPTNNGNSMNTFSFGSGTSVLPTKPATSSGAFTFGAKSTNEFSSNPPPSMFGSVTPATSTAPVAVQFGSTAQANTSATATAASSPFAFGVKSDNTRTTGGFSFGTMTSPSSALSNQASTPAVNSFSAAAAPTLSAADNTSNTFAVPTNSNQTTAKQSFSFVGAAADPTKSLFGNTMPASNNLFSSAANSDQSKTFNFGSTALAANNNNSNNNSSSNNNLFSASSATNNLFSASSATNNNNNNNDNNLFGTLASAAKTDQSKTFSFGGKAPTSSNNSNLFGVAENPQQSKTFSFGAAASASNNLFGTLASAANSDQSKTFNFGANNTSALQSSSSSNIFAAPSSTSSAAGGFAFGAVTNSANLLNPLSPPTTTATTTATPLKNTTAAASSTTNSFAFGSNSKISSVAPFSFGGANSTPIKNFSFIGEATNNANGNTTEAVQPSTAFNFSSNSLSQNATTPFAAQPSVGGDRPIRRATRRLQK